MSWHVYVSCSLCSAKTESFAHADHEVAGAQAREAALSNDERAALRKHREETKAARQQQALWQRQLWAEQQDERQEQQDEQERQQRTLEALKRLRWPNPRTSEDLDFIARELGVYNEWRKL